MNEDDLYCLKKLEESYRIKSDELSKLSIRQCHLLMLLLQYNNDCLINQSEMISIEKPNNVFLCSSNWFFGLNFVLLLYIKYCRIKNIIFISYTKRESETHFNDFINLLSEENLKIKIDYLNRCISFFSMIGGYESIYNNDLKRILPYFIPIESIEICINFYQNNNFKIDSFNKQAKDTLYIWGNLLYNEMKSVPNIFNLRSIWLLNEGDIVDPSLYLDNPRLSLKERENTAELADLTQRLLFNKEGQTTEELYNLTQKVLFNK